MGVAHGEWYRLLTAGFLHEGIIHLGLNMAVLWILGRVTEAALGRSRMVMVYFVSLFAGSFGACSYATGGDRQRVGAIFGLMGGLLVVARARGIRLRDTGLLPLVGINLAFTFASPNVSVGGHLGGFIGGALATFVLVDLFERVPSLRSQGQTQGQRRLTTAVGAGVTIALIVGLVIGSVIVADNAALHSALTPLST